MYATKRKRGRATAPTVKVSDDDYDLIYQIVRDEEYGYNKVKALLNMDEWGFYKLLDRQEIIASHIPEFYQLLRDYRKHLKERKRIKRMRFLCSLNKLSTENLKRIKGAK